MVSAEEGTVGMAAGDPGIGACPPELIARGCGWRSSLS